MKVLIPQDCKITKESLDELKREINILIKDYDEYKDKYKIFLYENFLEVIYENEKFIITIVDYKDVLFWYIKPFDNEYLLIRNTGYNTLRLILDIIPNLV